MKKLLRDMKSTYQDKGKKQTILQHGKSVKTYFNNLVAFLQSSESSYQYPIADWLLTYKSELLDKIQTNRKNIDSYLLFHDCGKPYCLTEDEKGQHFKKHAQISKEIYIKHFGDGLAADLIGDDMLCHITKAKDYMQLVENSNIEILLCSSLAELHSNAQMFGGFDSDSFKIKFKNLNKLGDRVLSYKYVK